MQYLFPPLMFFAMVVQGRWQPGIGDPTPMGWITTASYFLAAALCFRAAWHAYNLAPPKLGRRAMSFWILCGLVMLFLCINKQLDLQTLGTQLGRDWAKSGGWYGERRVFQTWFIRGTAGVGLLGVLFLGWLVHGGRLAYYLAVIGLVFTGCFVLVRAASIHHVDALIGYQIAGIKMNWVFELGGVVVVGAAALAARERPVAVEKEDVDSDGDDEDIPEIIVL